MFVRKALRRCSFTLKRYYYRIERTGVLRFYIAVTYYYHNGTLVVLNVQRHEDGAMSRDLRVGFQPFVDWQRFSRRSARYQNAYSHSRQLRQSRKFIVAINLSASATPLEWPESSSFFFPLYPSFPSVRRISRPFNRDQLDWHKPGTVLGPDVILVRERRRNVERRKKPRRAREHARIPAIGQRAYLPFTHNGTDCLSRDRRIHESFIVVLQPQLAHINAIAPRHQPPSLSRRRRSPVIISR